MLRLTISRPAASLPRGLCLVLGLLLCALASAAEEFPRPAGLEPEIAFWRTVFARTDTDHAVVHDNRHLSVVYETIRLPADASARERRAASDRVREKYRRILAELASGRRQGLTSEPARVLAL